VYCGNLKIKDTMYYEIVIQQKKKRESHYISLGRDEKVGTRECCTIERSKFQTPYLLWKDIWSVISEIVTSLLILFLFFGSCVLWYEA